MFEFRYWLNSTIQCVGLMLAYIIGAVYDFTILYVLSMIAYWIYAIGIIIAAFTVPIFLRDHIFDEYPDSAADFFALHSKTLWRIWEHGIAVLMIAVPMAFGEIWLSIALFAGLSMFLAGKYVTIDKIFEGMENDSND